MAISRRHSPLTRWALGNLQPPATWVHHQAAAAAAARRRRADGAGATGDEAASVKRVMNVMNPAVLAVGWPARGHLIEQKIG